MTKLLINLNDWTPWKITWPNLLGFNIYESKKNNIRHFDVSLTLRLKIPQNVSATLSKISIRIGPRLTLENAILTIQKNPCIPANFSNLRVVGLRG